MVAAVRHLYELTGGFGVVLGFAHDWANREATARSWDLVARYVIPELNGQLRPLRASAEHLHEHKAELMAGASAAVMQKILANPRAADAMVVTMQQIAARRASRPEPDGADADGAEPDDTADSAGARRRGAGGRPSVVPQGHRVRRHVDLGLVLGRLHLAGRGRRSGRAARSRSPSTARRGRPRSGVGTGGSRRSARVVAPSPDRRSPGRSEVRGPLSRSSGGGARRGRRCARRGP